MFYGNKSATRQVRVDSVGLSVGNREARADRQRVKMKVEGLCHGNSIEHALRALRLAMRHATATAPCHSAVARTIAPSLVQVVCLAPRTVAIGEKSVTLMAEGLC